MSYQVKVDGSIIGRYRHYTSPVSVQTLYVASISIDTVRRWRDAADCCVGELLSYLLYNNFSV